MAIHSNTEKTSLSRRRKPEIKVTETVEKSKPVKQVKASAWLWIISDFRES